jgi:glucosylceramidase
LLGYGGDERTQDGTYGYNNVNASYHHAKHKLLISTEGCSCPGVSYNDWLRAERLGHDILYDLQNFAQGWIDWNLLLDEHGGPNHLNNFCDASLIANGNFSDIHIQPKYFYFGHFSKFLPPNSIRIKSHIMGNYNYEVMDPVMQATTELGMFPCEKSVRQMWGLNAETHTLFLTTQSDIAWINAKIQLCVAYGDIARPYLHLADCATSQPEKLLQVEYNLLFGQLVDVRTGLCITLADDVRESGALLNLQECKVVESNEQHKEELHDDQFFTMVPGTGEIYALEATNPICITAGWPFLNAVSFHTEKEKHVTIIMNEAPVSTTVTLMDIEKESSLQVPVPARSIHTIVY